MAYKRQIEDSEPGMLSDALKKELITDVTNFFIHHSIISELLK